MSTRTKVKRGFAMGLAAMTLVAVFSFPISAKGDSLEAVDASVKISDFHTVQRTTPEREVFMLEHHTLEKWRLAIQFADPDNIEKISMFRDMELSSMKELKKRITDAKIAGIRRFYYAESSRQGNHWSGYLITEGDVIVGKITLVEILKRE